MTDSVNTEVVKLTETERVVVGDTKDTVVVHDDKGTVVVTGMIGPPGASKINTMDDIDLTNLADGATLVYAQNTAKWQATNLLEKQVMNGGFF